MRAAGETCEKGVEVAAPPGVDVAAAPGVEVAGGMNGVFVAVSPGGGVDVGPAGVEVAGGGVDVRGGVDVAMIGGGVLVS